MECISHCGHGEGLDMGAVDMHLGSSLLLADMR